MDLSSSRNVLNYLRASWLYIVSFSVLIVFTIGLFMFAGLWREVGRKLNQGVFHGTANLYAAARTISVGQSAGSTEIISQLRHAGYRENPSNATGYFLQNGDSLEIHPGKDSYFRLPAVVLFHKGQIAGIEALPNHAKLTRYSLEPQLIANLATDSREQRRLLRYGDMPKVLVEAVLSAEDKHFFSHFGFDSLRILKATYVNLRDSRKEQGGSTLTMQLARNLWLDEAKTWRRKFTEMLITFILERRLPKEKIFEHYANEVYLGQHETFAIHGFGQAAWIYFSKDVGKLTLPEAALLAGMIQRPSYFDPVRHPDLAVARRNIVLNLMQRNGFIAAAQREQAAASPVGLSLRQDESGDAPYFMALTQDELQKRLGDKADSEAPLKVYTTLDQNLQRLAVASVRSGMERLDKLIRSKAGNKKDGKAPPQAALIALDPHTGEVKAAVGGRKYAASQLNRILAMRQPGSAFKPFVYAAALQDQNSKKSREITLASTLPDEPTTFRFGFQTYAPTNFGGAYFGRPTLRTALARSLNVATVSLAEEVGFDKVVELARRAGFNAGLQPTPAIALGAYETTPLELAGGYTTFANAGERVEPTFIASVRSASGETIIGGDPKRVTVLDPKVAFLMLEMLQEVMRSGTAAGARASGFTAPAAGKTGTSRDGWFAGFTSDLLCVVWVGYDDNRELPLEGADSALPIWTDFMKQALKYGDYAKPFGKPPAGITSELIDADTGMLAGPNCPSTRYEYFIAGTEVHTVCTDHTEPVAATPRDESSEEQPAVVVNPTAETGKAMFYASDLNGKATASGEPLDNSAMTASDPSLPLGSRVKVTNIANGKSVIVRINDRLAASSGRVISVTQRAAQELGFVTAGSAQVRLELVPEPLR